jgi:hypothetical protein
MDKDQARIDRLRELLANEPKPGSPEYLAWQDEVSRLNVIQDDHLPQRFE